MKPGESWPASAPSIGADRASPLGRVDGQVPISQAQLASARAAPMSPWISAGRLLIHAVGSSARTSAAFSEDGVTPLRVPGTPVGRPPVQKSASFV